MHQPTWMRILNNIKHDDAVDLKFGNTFSVLLPS